MLINITYMHHVPIKPTKSGTFALGDTNRSQGTSLLAWLTQNLLYGRLKELEPPFSTADNRMLISTVC